MPQMRVFISWSGERSKQLGAAIRDWLPKTLQYVKPFFSETDTQKGGRWSNQINAELATSFGIFVLTPENTEREGASWMMYEAGAISRDLEVSRPWTILFDLKPTDIKGPLSDFQHTRFTPEDFRRLFKGINDAAPKDRALPDSDLDAVFDTWWPALEDRVKRILEAPVARREPAKARTERDLIEETLTLVRNFDERLIKVEVFLKDLNARMPAPGLFSLGGSGLSFGAGPPPEGLLASLLRGDLAAGTVPSSTGLNVGDLKPGDSPRPPRAPTIAESVGKSDDVSPAPSPSRSK
jgi:hypothetical protein